MKFAAIACIFLAVSQAQGKEVFTRGVHDPCIAKEAGSYYVFATARGIDMRQSDDLVHWRRNGQVFDSLPAWATAEIPAARNLWAPDISFFNGEYHLYYAVSTFGSNRSCIGLVTNKTLDPKGAGYKWTDHGKVIESKKGDDWNAIDLVYHFYDAESNGTPCLQIRPLKWENDWPIAGDPLPGVTEPDAGGPARQ